MSISGTAAGRPHSISYSVVCRCLPFTRMPTSALVPPMSSVSTFGSPSARATCSVAVIPPAGPLITVWIGASAAAPESMAPPFDFISVHSRVIPAERSELSRLCT